MPVHETQAMIAGMAPVLVPGACAFVCLEGEAAVAALPEAVAAVWEAQGVTLVLPLGHPALPADAIAMRQITLTVHSALDGVGLTAAVATALAEGGIPCNVIAGFHHDHLFVPFEQADHAVEILQERALQV